MDQANHRVDVAVIGAGTAGLAAYRAATAVTDRVLLIEGGPHGTTCARVGCMPSKLLIAAAEAAHDAREAGPFGLRTDVSVDGRAVMDRVRSERDRFVGFVVAGVDKIPSRHLLQGRAQFVEPGVLEVSGERIHARAVVIATGSTPSVPPMFESVMDRVVINDDVFGWESLPRSVAVFGAGVIGLELGQALARLGVRVRIFGKLGGLGPITDPVVRDAAFAAIASEVPIDLDADVREVRRGGEGVEVVYGDRVETFAYALVATGRRPRLAGLALERAGVQLNPRGVPLFDRNTMQCGDTSVFIAGDVNDDVPLLHEAADEGRIAGDNAARFPNVRPGTRRSQLAITFSDPQLATIGERYASVREREDLVIGEVSFDDQGRSRVMRKNRGHLRLYVARDSGRLLGAELAGPRAENIAHLLAWAHQQSLTVAEMLAMPFYHPVIEEGLRTALRDAQSKLASA